MLAIHFGERSFLKLYAVKYGQTLGSPGIYHLSTLWIEEN